MSVKEINKFEIRINTIYEDIKKLKFNAKTICLSIEELEEDFREYLTKGN